MDRINSFGILSARLINIVTILDNILLTMTMAALGLIRYYSAFKKASIKPLIWGLIVFIWLFIVGGVVNFAIQHSF